MFDLILFIPPHRIASVALNGLRDGFAMPRVSIDNEFGIGLIPRRFRITTPRIIINDAVVRQMSGIVDSARIANPNPTYPISTIDSRRSNLHREIGR